MDIRLFLFFVIIFLGFGLATSPSQSLKQYNRRRLSYIIIICTLLIFESTLRGVSVVSDDTYFYIEAFKRVQNTSWSEIIANFYLTIEGEEKDPGYSVLVKFVQLLVTNFRIYLFLLALWFFVPLGKILYKYTTDFYHLIFAFVLFVALFNVVILSGIRQQIATGFSFWAFLALADGKKVKAIVIILLGTTMHITCSIMLSLIMLGYLKKYLKKIHFFSFITIPIVIQFGNIIALFLASLSPNDYYSGYGEHEAHNGSINYVLCMTAASVLAFISLRSTLINKSSFYKYLYSTLPMANMLAPLIMQGPSLIRLGQYFTLYYMIIIPITIDILAKAKYRQIFYISAIIFLMLMSLKTPFEYYFFWNDPGLY